MKSYIFSLWELLLVQFSIIWKHFLKFCTDVVKTVWLLFSSILGLIVSVITIVDFYGKREDFFNTFSCLDFNLQNPKIMVIIIIVSIIISVFWHWPKVLYVTKVSNIDIIIECCDLFKQEGLKVIHVVDTFNMDKVGEGTVADQFVDYCKSTSFNLKSAIESCLTNKEAVEDNSSDNVKRYPLGTVCVIRINTPYIYKNVNKDVFCLVAFTHWNEKRDSVDLTIEDYKKFLKTMWGNLADPSVKASNDVINVSVMGNKYMSLPTSCNINQKIGLMLKSFVEVAKEKKTCKKLRICIHKDDLADIDFAYIGTFIRYFVS